jgi:hypothetical protein
MPRIALACLGLVAACSFEADYAGGMYLCESGKCPDGLVCDTLQQPARCIEPRMDAATIDTATDDAMTDARQAALTCNDPGLLPTAGGTNSGNTATSGLNLVSPMCGAAVMNGLDDVYRIELPAGKQVLLSVSTPGAYQVAAYMIAPCAASSCLSSTYATPNNPATITTTTTTPQFIVVDSIYAGAGGAYTLEVTVQ